MDKNDILSAVVGTDENNRCKCTVGFFVEAYSDGPEPKLLDEYYLEKPAIELSEFTDEEGDEYYTAEFIYKSRRDEDLKLQWKFLDRYVERLLNASEKGEALPMLSVSFVPIIHNGEVSIFAKTAMPDSITKLEYAGEQLCAIQMIFLKQNVYFLEHDKELIDKPGLEIEVAKEIDAELDAEFGDENAE